MRTLILGFDAFDPKVFERLSNQGRLPNLSKYSERGGYSRFAVANPPQSEVSWTSIATGLNPGGHGIFDFVHREPTSYALLVSLLPTQRGLAGTTFVPPFKARTLFDQAADQGYPATMLWWPATFPARPESPVRTVPGLGTPDVQGRIGVGMFFTAGDEADDKRDKIAVGHLTSRGKNGYVGQLTGPARKKQSGSEESNLEFQLDLTGDRSARLTIGKQVVELVEGVWGPFLDLSFKMGRLMSVRALSRAILVQNQPQPKLYFLPLQIHPLHSGWRYSSHQGLVKEMWNECGPFLTLGWQQDTTALEEGCITDEQFRALCESILRFRECVLMQQLGQFREGVLASVFDSLDRIQHMFWRDRMDWVEAWYVQLDGLVGRVEDRLAASGGSPPRIVVVSDHGFTQLHYKVHLNRWLIDQGYLVPRQDGGAGNLKEVDWSKTRAYAVGLNSLYVNLAGREGQGSVATGDLEGLLGRLGDQLLAWQAADGQPVVKQVWRQKEAFDGPLAQYGPDLVVGYSAGYRASPETGLGTWEKDILEPNRDRWGGDHCMHPEVVPGVLFCNQGLRELSNPCYRDFPSVAIGVKPDESKSTPTVSYTEEDEEVVEERLRGLGYL